MTAEQYRNISFENRPHATEDYLLYSLEGELIGISEIVLARKSDNSSEGETTQSVALLSISSVGGIHNLPILAPVRDFNGAIGSTSVYEVLRTGCRNPLEIQEQVYVENLRMEEVGTTHNKYHAITMYRSINDYLIETGDDRVIDPRLVDAVRNYSLEK